MVSLTLVPGRDLVVLVAMEEAAIFPTFALSCS